MLRNVLYVKFVLLVVILASLALAIGSEPWGPN